MRYFDIRFSNICNFKCRTCGSGFSTQWEQEDLKNNVYHAKIIPKNDNKDFLKEVCRSNRFYGNRLLCRRRTINNRRTLYFIRRNDPQRSYQY
jgi:hypothetical protein